MAENLTAENSPVVVFGGSYGGSEKTPALCFFFCSLSHILSLLLSLISSVGGVV